MVVIGRCFGFLVRKFAKLTTNLCKITQRGAICDYLNFAAIGPDHLKLVMFFTQRESPPPSLQAPKLVPQARWKYLHIFLNGPKTEGDQKTKHSRRRL